MIMIIIMIMLMLCLQLLLVLLLLGCGQCIPPVLAGEREARVEEKGERAECLEKDNGGTDDRRLQSRRSHGVYHMHAHSVGMHT